MSEAISLVKHDRIQNDAAWKVGMTSWLRSQFNQVLRCIMHTVNVVTDVVQTMNLHFV